MNLRPLSVADAEQFQALRLAGLQECPSAFTSSYAEEASLLLTVVGERLSQREDRVVIGAFVAERLVGVVGVYREPMRKLSHKANLWGMYVASSSRRSGVGRALVDEALAFAARELRVLQVNLDVNTTNAAAIHLYECLAFKRFGVERDFMLLDGVPQDGIHMVCKLAAAKPNPSIEATS